MAEGSVEDESGEMLGPSGAPALQGMHTPAPTDLSVKDEESDSESSTGSPEPAEDAGSCTDLSISVGRPLPPAQVRPHDEFSTSDNKMSSPGPPHPASHLNGTMASLVTLQNLQNLANLQQNLPQVASLAANLSTMASLSGTTSLNNSTMANAPLNLSISATSVTTPRSSQPGAPEAPPSGIAPLNPQPPPAPTLPTSNPLMSPPQQPAPMPQFILASGQLVQGIQGAQLLIPTSQGLATQTILTIPVNHVNSSDQMVNLALNNGQVMQTSLANLQAIAQSNLLANTANNAVPTTNGTINPSLLNPTTLSHLLSTSSPAQQLLQTLPQLITNPHASAAAQPQPPLLNSLAQPLLSTPPTMLPTPAAQSTAPRPPLSNNHFGETKHHPAQSISRNSSPTMGNVPNRIGSSNGDLSIPSSMGLSSGQSVKRSPSSLSPGCNDTSTADLLIDSPNQPTINQTSSNVVDGINLDEIKDFAKAFKLRRLSLGLTQTQVGQALSVTEGPAYSQSAICSALASQMVAAAQQQAMFEKLDITPKSAQKIKPVLERWMKEAEERYKSGQNHLTDFIGIEPSKKRKRRTSFTPQALELLNAHFERNTHPSGTEITGLAHQLGYEREVIRIWFCNKRQALKNTVRMMSKGMV
ncbi:POU domain, class 6, transcription factor 2 isoform X2 [Cylas formicarius]|uniref:POU domain, class 6, transcription factor 2 isoform X2 n=1 Tax=Cylas formicarius TaxID=197179 RepID=UPI0029584C83|nr:POU domain, class 6, transcription factor 2 isoform X2 [Cylas formicarius]